MLMLFCTEWVFARTMSHLALVVSLIQVLVAYIIAAIFIFLHVHVDAEGKESVKFGILFSDDRCGNLFEALVGTLRAAKRKKIISFEGEMLFQGKDDNVDIVLLKDTL